ncbi:MAG: adenylate/guanylate cyclase domain-containing protein, partial [Pseudomonadota bacterium]
MDRQLAAVLAADIVGYSTMMGKDELGTLAAIKDFRLSLFEPLVTSHRGEVINSLGDGWLVTFPSTVDAVNCAITMQEKVAIEGAMRVRVGVHIGDIVRQDDDIFGDTVNIAARLESIVNPPVIGPRFRAFSRLSLALAGLCRGPDVAAARCIACARCRSRPGP